MKAVDREQLVMKTIDVERLIEEGHPARMIWEFVGEEELGEFYKTIKWVEGEVGGASWAGLRR